MSVFAIACFALIVIGGFIFFYLVLQPTYQQLDVWWEDWDDQTELQHAE
jgi:hypothetical protein